MDTARLDILLKIVACGSIQGAARQLGVTRASVRRVLDILEAEVGAPLFHRDATGGLLTAAGAVVVERARVLLQTSRAMVSDARAAAGEAAGVLHLVEPVGLPLSLHARVILAARLALPNLAVTIRVVEDPIAHLHEPFELMLHEGANPGLRERRRAGGGSRRGVSGTSRRLTGGPGKQTGHREAHDDELLDHRVGKDRRRGARRRHRQEQPDGRDDERPPHTTDVNRTDTQEPEQGERHVAGRERAAERREGEEGRPHPGHRLGRAGPTRSQ